MGYWSFLLLMYCFYFSLKRCPCCLVYWNAIMLGEYICVFVISFSWAVSCDSSWLKVSFAWLWSLLVIICMASLSPPVHFQPTWVMKSKVSLLYTVCSWILFLIHSYNLYLFIWKCSPFTFIIILKDKDLHCHFINCFLSVL